MAYVIAQVSDTHVGGPVAGCEQRLSAAVEEINRMSRQPNLVLFTGDLTQNGSDLEWAEFTRRVAVLVAPWAAIPGNHDRGVAAIAGHRSISAGPLRLVLLDTSNDTFTEDDELWLDGELSAHALTPTIVAVHQPPFETGIWWMDCLGLQGAERMEDVVRRHRHVVAVLSGHIHRPIHTTWDGCSLWVCPSTSGAVAADLDAAHDPAETAEAPAFSLHVWTGRTIVSHVIPIGPSAHRTSIADHSPAFVAQLRSMQAERTSVSPYSSFV